MSSNKQINELKRIIKSDEKRMNRGGISSPSGEVFVLILIALLASAALSMSIYTYEDNKDKPSSAFTKIDIKGNTGTGNEEVVAVGRSKLTLVAKAGLSITGTNSDTTIEFLNTRSSGTGAPSAPLTSVQFNNGGAFGGDAGLTYNQGTTTLTADNINTNRLVASGLTYPTTAGNPGEVITTDGVGTLSFATAGGVSELSNLNDAQNGGPNFSESVIIGQKAPTTAIVGSEKNTAIGLCAIFSLTSGSNNTAIGFKAGNGITTGTSCTFIGASTGITAGISGHNITCLGFGAQPSAPGVTDEITLGDSTIQTLRCAGETIVSLSDGRDKTNVVDTQFGLNFLNKLRPVDYTWQRRVLEPSDINHPKNGKRRTGFIAQELLEAAGEDGNNILDLVYQSNPERIEARYGNLIPVLVKSVQDLSNKVAVLEEKIENLQK
jgi:hypothetical protein